jgi:glycosidase
LIQFAFPGAPAVYYGDEIGLEGGADPDSRRAFSWEESAWDADLRSSIQGLIRARSQTPALRRGDMVPLFADDDRRWCAFVRRSEGHAAVVVANASSDSQSFDLSLSEAGWRPETAVTDVISGVRYPVARGRTRISLGPWGGLILVPSESTASGSLSQV